MKVEDALSEGQTSQLKVITANMTRRAERMMHETVTPVSKSDDPKFVEQVQDAVKELMTSKNQDHGYFLMHVLCLYNVDDAAAGIKPHEHASQELLEKPKEEEVVESWRAANRKVCTHALST